MIRKKLSNHGSKQCDCNENRVHFFHLTSLFQQTCRSKIRQKYHCGRAMLPRTFNDDKVLIENHYLPLDLVRAILCAALYVGDREFLARRVFAIGRL